MADDAAISSNEKQSKNFTKRLRNRLNTVWDHSQSTYESKLVGRGQEIVKRKPTIHNARADNKYLLVDFHVGQN